VFTSENASLKLNGQKLSIKGVSWFGFETNANVFHGLWNVDYKYIIDFLANNSFNGVRIPFSLDLVINNPNPNTISYGYCSNNANCNADLKGLTSLQILDKMIAYMGTKGMLVMLDMHSFEPDGASNNGLWYDSSHTEAQVIQGWQALATRYKDTWNVFAMDVKN
jgi:aryl-phospho-beta-D-glucosidase BglC (GH1 family)